jgi:multidrug resistance efflux pump
MKIKNAFAESSTPARRAAISSFLLIMSLVLASCGGSKEQQDKAGAGAAAAVPVIVTSVIQQTVPIITEFAARAEARDTVELRARVEAFLDGIHFQEGRPVKKGQLLFTLDKRKYEAEVQNAKAQLAKAKADLQFAQEKVTVESARANLEQAKAELGKADLDVSRFTPLAKENAVPQQDLDNALIQQQVAKANVDSAKANYETVVLNQKVTIDQAMAAVMAGNAAVDNAQLDLSYCTITAPMDGLIGQRLVSPGNLVGRGEPTLLATISTLDPLRVSFAISEAEYLKIAARMGVYSPIKGKPLLQNGPLMRKRGR